MPRITNGSRKLLGEISLYIDARLAASAALVDRLKLEAQACVVCGYPTVGKDDFDICRICHWMYERIQLEETFVPAFISIEKARANFKRYLICFGPEDGKRSVFLVGEAVYEDKRLVVEHLDALLALGDASTLGDFQSVADEIVKMDKKGKAIAKEVIPKIIASEQN